MFQNHLLQLLTVAAMEVPVRFDADLSAMKRSSCCDPSARWPLRRGRCHRCTDNTTAIAEKGSAR